MNGNQTAQGNKEIKKERYTLLITVPKDAVGDEAGRWQPTQITAREGWQEITVWMRIVYIGFVVCMCSTTKSWRSGK